MGAINGGYWEDEIAGGCSPRGSTTAQAYVQKNVA